MERIKTAFEKAQAQREAAAPSPAPQTGGKPRPRPALQSIQYSKTSVVKPDTFSLQEHRILTAFQQGQWTEIYKRLRTQVLQRMEKNGWNTLAISSANPQEGKTVTSINLAISIALEVDKTVLLVEADMTRPKLHEIFGLTSKYGLADYLAGEVPLEEILVNPGIPSFVLLPAGKPRLDSAEMLVSPMMKELVTELKTRYPSRYILFDLPALLTVADPLAFSKYVDTFLLVAEEGKTTREDFKTMLKLLEHVPVVGTILNKSRQNLISFRQAREESRVREAT